MNHLIGESWFVCLFACLFTEEIDRFDGEGRKEKEGRRRKEGRKEGIWGGRHGAHHSNKLIIIIKKNLRIIIGNLKKKKEPTKIIITLKHKSNSLLFLIFLCFVFCLSAAPLCSVGC